MKTQLIGYWAVGTSAWNGATRKPGDLFVSTAAYQAGAAETYTAQGYTLIPSYIKHS